MPAARTAASLPLLRGGRLLLGMGGGRVDIASLEDNIGVQQVIAERARASACVYVCVGKGEVENGAG